MSSRLWVAIFAIRRMPFTMNMENAIIRKTIFISLTRAYETAETRSKRKDRPTITMDENTIISSILAPLSVYLETV